MQRRSAYGISARYSSGLLLMKVWYTVTARSPGGAMKNFEKKLINRNMRNLK
jgi:hypothetical protein